MLEAIRGRSPWNETGHVCSHSRRTSLRLVLCQFSHLFALIILKLMADFDRNGGNVRELSVIVELTC